MSGDVYPINSISFFIQNPKGDHPTEEEMIELGAQVAAYFRELLEHDDRLRGVVSIRRVDVRCGCTIATISLVVGLVGTVAQYSQIKTSVAELARDVQGLWVKLERWAKPYRVWLYREDLVDYDEKGEIRFRGEPEA